jgi:hypothetical protein
MLAALAERVEGPGTGGPGPIAALADRLAWSGADQVREKGIVER